MTEIIAIDDANEAGLARAAASLSRGGIVCLPNDTVYGIACSPEFSDAVARLYQVKRRRRDKPLAMVFGEKEAVFDLLPELPPAVRAAVAALLPGPVTVVLDAAGERANTLAATLGSPGSLAVRVLPPPLDAIYRQLPSPLALTSANLSGQPDPCSLEEVAPEVLAACEFAVDAGRCATAVPSTIVDLRPLATGEAPVILREGPVSATAVIRSLGGK
ncbi:MAG: L-threonylcarbamoyladenylate synthase [Thermoleophilia bacterium]